MFKRLRNIKKFQQEIFTSAADRVFIVEKKRLFDPLLKKCEAVVLDTHKKEDAKYWHNTVLNKMLASAGNNPSQQVIFFRAWIRKLAKRISEGKIKTSDKTIMAKQFIPYINLTLVRDFKRARNISFGALKTEKVFEIDGGKINGEQ